MPKEPRNPVRLSKRSFAVQDNAVEHVHLGSAVAESADDVLHAMDQESNAPTLKKKEKQQIKRDALRQRLEADSSPYSKSHERRVKRKAKEQLAGATMDDIQAALVAVDEPAPVEAANSARPKPKAKPGQIGEGKPATLSQKQRQKVLQTERLRHPQILREFALTNPFQTIRTHTQNTLVKHST
ncbi:ribosome biogenesis protein SLX9-domain-containing protein [Mycena amicta]|nr:ribosome biogenesis protein SLX9-domain-containing protein [Mycena amicta]